MIPSEQITAALNHLLASEGFVNSPRLCRFVSFAVEKELAGDGASLKEYLLGTEVFDRGADFDPRLDPIVRVEARRLRSKLQEYYEGPGREATIRIAFPKGSYAPTFEAFTPTPTLPIETPRRRSWHWMLPAIAVVGLIAIAWSIRSVASAERLTTIVVVPFSDPQDQEFADALGEAVASELSRNSNLRVVAWPLFVEYRMRNQKMADESLQVTAKNLGAEAVLALSIRRSDDRRRIEATLMKPKQGWKHWAGEYERGLNEPFTVQREVARAIAQEVRSFIIDRSKEN